jgi:hypothetical protein
MGGWAFWWATAVVGGLPALLFAQNQAAPQPGETDAEWRARMEARVGQLELENAELKQRVSGVAETQQAVMSDAQSRGILTMESGQPRLTTPDFFDVNKYAAEGDFPGSIRVPGTKTSFQIGGFVQLDMMKDSDRIGDNDAFVVNTIPTGDDKAGAGDANFSVRQTRLFLKTQTPTDTWGDLVTYVEIDFFGTDGTEPRLRHGYGQVGDKQQFLAGQTWSAFQDATVFPATLDFQGPPGIITNRRPQVRYKEVMNEQWSGVVSLEDPKSDITAPAGEEGEAATPYPDLDSNVRWTPDWGHLQLSGVIRYLEWDPDSGSREGTPGYGLNLTGSIKTLRIDDKHIDTVLFQVADGNGIARYINDTGGLGLDGFLAAPGDDLDGVNTFAGVIAYQHWWALKWASTASYSIVTVDNDSSAPGSEYHSGQYGVVNLRYYPADRVMLGGEVLYGIREDNDGSRGDDVRLQFSAQYKF